MTKMVAAAAVHDKGDDKDGMRMEGTGDRYSTI